MSRKGKSIEIAGHLRWKEIRLGKIAKGLAVFFFRVKTGSEIDYEDNHTTWYVKNHRIVHFKQMIWILCEIQLNKMLQSSNYQEMDKDRSLKRLELSSEPFSENKSKAKFSHDSRNVHKVAPQLWLVADLLLDFWVWSWGWVFISIANALGYI